VRNSELLEQVLIKLRRYWSPDQIAKWLKNEYNDSSMRVSAETIYTYIYILPRGELRKELIQCLRREKKYRRPITYHRKGQSSDLSNMISIEERPAEVADRTIPGHWEGDIIIGDGMAQTALGTLVERTTRSLLLVPLKNKSAKEVRHAFAREIKKLPKEMRLTLTYDQGREMAEHELFTKSTKMQVYFAHPRSPWERGTNENTNALIRQFFPKTTNFNSVSRKRIKEVQHLLNERPRKTLGYRSPYQALATLFQGYVLH
jgi:IS30 family transposase